MARKDKDLFVLLQERMTKRRGKPASGSSAKASTGRGSARRSTAGGLGDWFRSVLRITQPENRAGARASKQVPRGLLVPGWLPIVLLVLGLGGGFVIGRWTAGSDGQKPLSTSGDRVPGGQGGHELGSFPDRKSPKGGSRLSSKKATERLSNYFVAVLEFAASQRDRAARTAQYLRECGLPTARIQRVRNAGGDVVWMTICYVKPNEDPKDAVPYSVADAGKILDRLRRTPEPDFAKEFAGAVQALGTVEQAVLEFQ